MERVGTWFQSTIVARTKISRTIKSNSPRHSCHTWPRYSSHRDVWWAELFESVTVSFGKNQPLAFSMAASCSGVASVWWLFFHSS
jgi:hypothetical protein